MMENLISGRHRERFTENLLTYTLKLSINAENSEQTDEVPFYDIFILCFLEIASECLMSTWKVTKKNALIRK